MTIQNNTKKLNPWRLLKIIFLLVVSLFVIFDSASNLTENILAVNEVDSTSMFPPSTFTIYEVDKTTKIIFCDEIIDSSDLDFIKEMIASTESQANQFKPKDTMIYHRSWYQVNAHTDAAGRYQFVRKTRKSVAKHLNEPEPNFQEFLNDREMQDRYLIALLESNHEHFKKPIKLYDKTGKVIASYPYTAYEKFEGKVINGYYISKSGMILMSQAIGAQGTIDWMMHGCKPSKLPPGAPIADRRLSVNIF